MRSIQPVPFVLAAILCFNGLHVAQGTHSIPQYEKSSRVDSISSPAHSGESYRGVCVAFGRCHGDRKFYTSSLFERQVWQFINADFANFDVSLWPSRTIFCKHVRRLPFIIIKLAGKFCLRRLGDVDNGSFKSLNGRQFP